MEYIIIFYFGINLMFLGSYLMDEFNNDKKTTKILASLVLLFFGGLLFLWELTFAEKFEQWFYKSSLGFYWELYIDKKFDNLDENTIKYLKNRVLDKKGTKRDLQRIGKILKRNN